MNSTKRKQLIKQVERLHNMFAASRSSLEEFSAKRKTHIDEILVDIAREAIPRNYLRKPPRLWADLRPQDADRLRRRLRRTALRDGYKERPLNRLRASGIIDAETQLDSLSWSKPYRSLYGRKPPVLLPEGTPAHRLLQRRQSMLRTYSIYKIIKEPEFVLNLHPDDVEWSIEDEGDGLVMKAVAATNILKLNKLFGTNRRVLAALPYIEDPDTKTEVYYCARLHIGRSAPHVERCYIGRQWDPATRVWAITEPYKSSAGCYTACHGIFSAAISGIIYKEEDNG